jgi:hypothetical protein
LEQEGIAGHSGLNRFFFRKKKVDKYDKKTTEWKEVLPAEDSLLVIRLERKKKKLRKKHI